MKKKSLEKKLLLFRAVHVEFLNKNTRSQHIFRNAREGESKLTCVMSVMLGVIFAQTGTVALALIQPDTSSRSAQS